MCTNNTSDKIIVVYNDINMQLLKIFNNNNNNNNNNNIPLRAPKPSAVASYVETGFYEHCEAPICLRSAGARGHAVT